MRGVWFGLLLFFAGGATAQERTLYWKALDVSARLEADARLNVVERHYMVFDGAWNGGERTFRLGQGQHVQLLHLRRIDPSSGEARELRLGNLSEVDQFRWSGRSLRWRTRRPADPPYRNETLVFEIEYALTGVVFADGDHYRIDHDFAFPDRPAKIERFTLKFEHDPVWKGEAIPPVENENLPPGESVVLHLPLQYAAQGQPAFINRPPPPPAPLPPRPPPLTMAAQVRAAGVALLLLMFLLLVAYFFRRETSVGRFESWDHLLPTGQSWLQQNIFAHPAEVIGAAWDETSSEPEVSALLARLIQEGKIMTLPKEITKQVSNVVLGLKVPRSELQEHERALVDALFVQGDVTDGPTIRSYYRTHGFDPASVLRAPMMRKVEDATSRAFGASTTTSRKVGSLLIFILVLTLVAGFASLSAPRIGGPLVLFSLLSGACLIAALAAASRYRRKVLGLWPAVTVIAPLVVIVFVAALQTHPVLFAIFGIESLLLSWYVLRKARWHGTGEFLQWRRNLVAARDWFAFELGKPDPELKDEWTPYLIAFGLTTAMDEWTRKFAAPKPPGTSSSREQGSSIRPFASSPASSSEPVRSWTGGGGAFGGAGATGSWASEVASFAAVIAPPAATSSSYSSSSSSFSSSSSRSSFSSSSSSSRSGGGGGGGW